MATTSSYDEMTRAELYDLAQQREVEGRSDMTKDELVAALEATDVGPDALELLLSQHRDIEALFDRFEQLSDRPSQGKQDLVREIISTLVRHAEIEEQIFYPAVAEEVAGVQPELDEDLEEHHAAELLLWELDHLDVGATRYDAKVTVLMENVRHHIEEEEEDLFPRVRESMPEQRRRELGAALRDAWDTVPERPHPLSPDTPPGNVVVSGPAAVVDRVINLARAGVELVRRG